MARRASSRRLRLDAELVRRGLARSREHARELIAAGRVGLNGVTAAKPATGVAVDADLLVRPSASAPPGPDGRAGPGATDYVSRGAHKLLGAVEVFGEEGLRIDGRRALDAGASTGGFTQVLLLAGAREVVAVDVGYGQLAWSLREDPRVRVHERTNVRLLDPDLIGGPVDLVVGDLSFISLRLLLDPLIAVTQHDGDLVLMVKPQFEIGRERLGRGGVVRDLGHRAETVWRVVEDAGERGWGARGVSTSRLPGPSGNVEFFVWLRRGPGRVTERDVQSEVSRSPGLSGPDERLPG